MGAGFSFLFERMKTGEILRAGLDGAKTKADVVELCRRELINLEAEAHDHVLFIRYLQKCHYDTCHGILSGYYQGTADLNGPKVAIGLSFVLPGNEFFIGGSALHPGDRWNRHVGKVVAALTGVTMSASTALLFMLRNPPWHIDSVMTAKELKRESRTLPYPWDLLGMSVPKIALPVATLAIRHAWRYMTTRLLDSFTSLAVTVGPGTGAVWQDADNLQLARVLIDKYCTLPAHIKTEGKPNAPAEGANARGCADTSEVSA